MSKHICEESRRISISWIKKRGYLTHGNCSGIVWTSSDGSKSDINYQIDLSNPSPSMRLMYTVTFHWDGEKKDFDYKIPIMKQNCFFGGFRWWFVCPLFLNGVYCGKRTGTLYNYSNGYYGCRICTRRAYRSQNERKDGYFGGFTCALDLLEAKDALRIKYYKGQPTKRYERLNRKMSKFEHRLNTQDPFLNMVKRERKFRDAH